MEGNSLLCDSLNQTNNEDERGSDNEDSWSDAVEVDDDCNVSELTCNQSTTFEEDNINNDSKLDISANEQAAQETKKVLETSLSESLKKEMEMKAKMLTTPRKKDVSPMGRLDFSPENSTSLCSSLQHQRRQDNSVFAQTLTTPVSCFDVCVDDDTILDDDHFGTKINILSLGSNDRKTSGSLFEEEIAVDDKNLFTGHAQIPSSTAPLETVYSSVSTDDASKPPGELKKADLDRYLDEIEQDMYANASQEAIMMKVKAPSKPAAAKVKTKKSLHVSKDKKSDLTKPTAASKARSQKATTFRDSKKPASKTSKVQKKDEASSSRHQQPKKQNNKKENSVMTMMTVDSPPMLEAEKVRGHLHQLLNHSNQPNELKNQNLDGSFEHQISAKNSKSSQPSSSSNYEETTNEEMGVQMMKLLKQAKLLTSSTNKNDVANNESNILHDTLERERYRRKHCEKEIQTLQKRILEIRQELAVAESVEAKKDAMVQQLDKMLVQMLSGWKSHEQNLVNTVQKLSREKDQINGDKKKLKQTITSLENDLANVLEELQDDKMKLVKTEDKHHESKKNFQSKTMQIQQAIDEKNKILTSCVKDKELLQIEVKTLKMRLVEAHQEFEKQTKIYAQEEAESNRTLQITNEKHAHEIEEYRTKLKTERDRVDELEEEMRKKSREIEDKDEIIRKMGLERKESETKMASDHHGFELRLKQLKDEHEIEIKNKISENLEAARKVAAEKEKEIIENNKKQVLNLIETHKSEIRRQSENYETELKKKDQSFRRAAQEIERSYHQKLEQKCAVVRDQMKARMQNLFQTHYDQTIRAMGDNEIPMDDNSPLVSRTYSNTRHVMISVPTPSPPSNKTNNLSILQKPFQLETSPTSNSIMPPSGEITSKYEGSTSVSDHKSHHPNNYHNHNKTHSLVDTIIEEKSKNILSSLDQKLLDLKNTNFNVSPPKPKPAEETKETTPLKTTSTIPHEITISPLQHHQTPPQVLKTNFRSSFGKDEAVSPPPNVNKKLEDITLTTAAGNSIELDEEEIERKKQLEHYVQRLLNLRPSSENTSIINNTNEISSLKSSLQSSSTSANTSTDKYPVRQQKSFEHVISANENDTTDDDPTHLTESMRRTVRFAMDGNKTSLSTQENLQPKTMIQHYHENMDSNKVEIAQLLGMYVTSPSGNHDNSDVTKQAASNLLEYLKTSPPIKRSEDDTTNNKIEPRIGGVKKSSPKQGVRIWK